MYHILEINTTPVKHGTLTGHTRKPDYSQLYKYSIRFGKKWSFGSSCRRVSILKISLTKNDNGGNEGRNNPEMRIRAQVQRHHHQTDGSTGKARSAPYTMECSHDGTTIQFFS